MRACFINPPIEDFYATSVRRQPLGLLSVAAAVRAAGHEVTLINGHTPARQVLPLPACFSYLREHLEDPDPRYAFPFRHYSRFGMSFEEARRLVRRSRADVFFISCLFTTYHEEADRLIAIVREERPGVPVAAGGYHASLHPAHLLETVGVDAVLRGEGEPAAVAYLEHLAGDRSLDAVPNCLYRARGSVIETPAAPPAELDALPLPARDLLRDRDFRMYRARGASMTASRGCPNRCTFCSSRIMWGDGYRRRSVDSIVAEIDLLYREHGVRWFNFEDDNLFPRAADAAALLPALAGYAKSRPEPIQFSAMNGVSLESLDQDALALMQAAGFRELNISLVTHSAALQATLARPFSSAAFRRIALEGSRLGMKVRAYFIIGLPGQTGDEIKETIAFLESLRVMAFPSVYYDVNAPREEWKMQRSSGFFNGTAELGRRELIGYFNRMTGRLSGY